MVYGALPPEMRRQQARLFNESGNGYDVLVASDAVGMGLNLNIRRIVFHTLQKYEGREMVSKDVLIHSSDSAALLRLASCWGKVAVVSYGIHACDACIS